MLAKLIFKLVIVYMLSCSVLANKEEHVNPIKSDQVYSYVLLKLIKVGSIVVGGYNLIVSRYYHHIGRDEDRANHFSARAFYAGAAYIVGALYEKLYFPENEATRLNHPTHST